MTDADGKVIHENRCFDDGEGPLRAASGSPPLTHADTFFEQTVVESALLFSLWYGAKIIGPMLGRAKPVLQFGHKFVALTQGPYPNGMDLWSVIDSCRIEWRPTIWTKRLLPFGAAFGCFDVYFQFT